ncbi:MAG: hypothetical protein ACI841_003499 [Planctomycetota bacterium]|jgi:hypothetical protein
MSLFGGEIALDASGTGMTLAVAAPTSPIAAASAAGKVYI